MDEFFTKYGWLVIAGVIIIIAITIATPVGEAIKKDVLSFISALSGKMDARIATMSSGTGLA